MKTADRLLAEAAYRCAAALCGTLRFSEEGREQLAAARAAGRPLLFVFWHNRLLCVGYRLARERLAIMASRSRDGDLIAHVAQRRGIAAVRGSTTRGGSSAVRALVRAMRGHGLAGGLAPDGPRGPACRLQPGALLIARLAGASIVPVAAGISRKKVFASWDRFQLPWPFARVRVVFGEPVEPPGEEEGPDALERRRTEVEQRLVAVTEAADRPFA